MTTKPKPVPWWLRRQLTPPAIVPFKPQREQAVSEHPHWAQPRHPTRAVRRRQARRLHAFMPAVESGRRSTRARLRALMTGGRR